MSTVNIDTGEIVDFDSAAAERRAERINEHFRAIREACEDLRVVGYYRRRSTHPQHLYFIEAVGVGMVKIGKAADVSTRLSELQTSSPHQLRVLGVLDGGGDQERRWHAAFAGQRVRGEWFHLDETLRICLSVEVGR